MSYTKTCNVDVLKTFDLRVRAANNFSPGLYSTLTTGPQQVYGSPLTWEYILLLSDVQGIKVQHSTIISTSYIILSTNTIYISTLLDNTLSTLSSYVFSNYEQLENSNVFLQGTLLYNVSNFYEQTDMIPYPSTISTIVYNFSTLSTNIRGIIPTLTFLSTTSTLHLYELSTIKSIYPSLVPSISTISTLNVNYSSLLTSTLKISESNLQSTVSASIYRYLFNASTTYYSFQSTLLYTSTFLISTYSSQYLTYSTINGITFNNSFSTIQYNFSSFSSLVGYQLSSVDVLYSNSILGAISTATALETNNINRNFSSLQSSITGTYSTLINTISTSQNIIDNNSTGIYKLSTQYTTFQTLSIGVALLDFYSSISRPQTFYELDFYLNNVPISTYYLPSSLSAGDIITNQSIAASYLENQFNYNSTILSSLFATNTSNAYYNIIKAYRANNIPLIDTICNSMYLSSFISSFVNPSLISTAFGQYSTQVGSTISQTYKIVVLSERLGIRNTSNTFITATNQSSSRSSITGSAFLSLSNEMGLPTSTSFNNLISYTFGSFRSNSELTLRILNQAELSNYLTMANYLSNITDHTIQDGFYHNLSTLFNSDFSTTKGILTSTTRNLLDTDSTFTRYLYSISSLSTFYYSNISTFQSTIFNITQSTFASSLTGVRLFNSTILSTQLSFLGPITSSFSTFLTKSVFSTLSTVMNEENIDLSNFVENTISNTLRSNITTLSNQIDTFNAAQAVTVSNFVMASNTAASNFLSTIYSHSINLSISQIVLSTFTTLSSIYFDGPLTMFEGGTNLIQQTRSPLHISYYGRESIQNLLYVNPTKNEVVVNSLKITGSNSVIFSNTTSTLGLDLNQYQNFNVDIQTMSNANPKIELYINFSTSCKFTQQGNINININSATANEIAAGRFLNLNNLGPQIRLDITRSFGYLKYKYLSINGVTFISDINDFTKTTSTVLPAGVVTTITNTNNANFVGIVTDTIGNIFVTDINTNSILKFDILTNTLNIFADGLNIPYNLTIDINNNMYVASFGNSTIYKVTPAGIKTIVTTGIPSPVGIVVDSVATYLYVSSLVTNRIYQLNITQSFPITITSQNNFVGSVDGDAGYADGIGPAATFRLVFGMTIDSSETMYVTDYGNNSIRKIVISTKLVTTIAGSTTGEAGNTIPYPLTNAIETDSGTDARFNKPTGIVADNLGNLFVCDLKNFAIRRIVLTTNDIITISGKEGGGYEDGDIIEDARYNQLYGILINAGKTNLFACDLNKIRQIGYNINAITGNSATEINAATAAEAAARYAVTLLELNSSRPIIMNCAVDSNHRIFLISATGIIFKYDPATLILTTFATFLSGKGYGLTIDSANNLYATDELSKVYKITSDGEVSDVKIGLTIPRAITISEDELSLYVSVTGSIIEITINDGTSEVMAGISSTTGIIDGIGSNARLDSIISGITLRNNVLYFSEFNNQTIRKLTLSSSNVTTISGTAGIAGSGNGIGKNAQFNGPIDIKNDLSGNLYVSDLVNNAIRKIDIASVVVTTLAGNTGSNVYPTLTNPDGIVNQAKLFGPFGISFDNPASTIGISTISTYINILVSTTLFYNSSVSSFVAFNFSSLSTATSINFLTTSNFSTFNYSTFSSFFNSPFLIYNLSSFSTATSTDFDSISTIEFSPFNLLNYSTFNMSTLSTIRLLDPIIYTTSTLVSTLSHTYVSYDIENIIPRTLFIIDGYGKLVRGFYPSFASSIIPMSTIINIDNSTIFSYRQRMSTIRINVSTVATQTFAQYLNTLQSYNDTLNAPPSGQKEVFVTAASNALSNSIVQSNIALTQSSLTSINFLSIVTISTSASAQFTILSYNANVFFSNASTLLIGSISASNLASNALINAQINAANAAAAYEGAVIAATQVSVDVNYSYTGFDQTFIVPAGVTKITVELLGASGSTAYTGDGSTRGGYVYGDLTVAPGQTYTIIVGGQNNDGFFQYGGGAAGSFGYGGSGGGRSAISFIGTDYVVAGGGGGDAYYTNGGLGGGLIGGSGYYGASGGTQSSGGVPSGFGAAYGSLQNGGNGSSGGGGGGGGYYGGGGGGGWGFGGAGGSSYVGRLTGTVVNTQGGGASSPANASSYFPQLTGHGRVKITYASSGTGTGTSTGTGTGTTAGVDPLTIDGCVFLFDASDTTTISTKGGFVFSWRNKGTAGGNANKGGGSAYTNTDQINGLNTITFGPNVTLNFVSALGGSGIVTFFCVTKITTDLTYIAQNLNFIKTTDTNGYGQAVKYDSGSPGNFLLYSYQGDSGVINCSQAFASGINIRDTTYLYTQRSGLFDAATIGQAYTTTTPNTNRSLINGTLGTLNTDITGNYATTSAFYTISGANDQNSQNMGELIVFNRALTDSEITQVNEYLKAKWGIVTTNYNGSFSYIVVGQTGAYYWANNAGRPETGPFEATSITGSPPTSALKSGTTRYDIIAVRTADFITATFTYVKSDGASGFNWSKSDGTTEFPLVIAANYNSGTSTAQRYGITWSVSGVATGGGGTYNDPYGYLIQNFNNAYYWADGDGEPELNSGSLYEATDPTGTSPNITTAVKTTGGGPTTYDVRGVVVASFIAAGYNYVTSNGSGGYNWCTSTGTLESPVVVAVNYNAFNSSAERYNTPFAVVDVYVSGGGGSGGSGGSGGGGGGGEPPPE